MIQPQSQLHKSLSADPILYLPVTEGGVRMRAINSTVLLCHSVSLHMNHYVVVIPLAFCSRKKGIF